MEVIPLSKHILVSTMSLVIVSLAARQTSAFFVKVKLPNEVLIISVHRDGKGLNVHNDIHLEEGIFTRLLATKIYWRNCL